MRCRSSVHPTWNMPFGLSTSRQRSVFAGTHIAGVARIPIISVALASPVFFACPRNLVRAELPCRAASDVVGVFLFGVRYWTHAVAA